VILASGLSAQVAAVSPLLAAVAAFSAGIAFRNPQAAPFVTCCLRQCLPAALSLQEALVPVLAAVAAVLGSSVVQNRQVLRYIR